MIKRIARIWRQLATIGHESAATLDQSRAFFAAASRSELAYARYESPAYLRRTGRRVAG